MAKVRKRTWQKANGNIMQSWLIDYVDNTGVRKLQSGFKTKAEAETALAKILTNVNQGINVALNKNITFDKAAEMHIKLHAELYCKESTCNGYKSYIKYHLEPFFKNTKMIDISSFKIKEFIKLKQEEGLSPQTINHCLNLIGAVFERLVDDNILTHNPTRKIKKLKIPHDEMQVLNQEQVKKVLQTAKDFYPDFYPLLFTALSTGLRRGELVALTWNDIEWEKQKIRVNKSFHKNKLTTPKTRNSIRTVDLSNKLAAALKEWKEICLKSNLNLLFPNQAGHYIDANNMVKRRFNYTLKLAELDRIRFHDLRHTYASLLISKNLPVKYIQMQMGHSSVKVTIDRYGHLMPDVYQKGIEALDSLF